MSGGCEKQSKVYSDSKRKNLASSAFGYWSAVLSSQLIAKCYLNRMCTHCRKRYNILATVNVWKWFGSFCTIMKMAKLFKEFSELFGLHFLNLFNKFLPSLLLTFRSNRCFVNIGGKWMSNGWPSFCGSPVIVIGDSPTVNCIYMWLINALLLNAWTFYSLKYCSSFCRVT